MSSSHDDNREALQQLQLENLALSEELARSEDENRHLVAKLHALTPSNSTDSNQDATSSAQVKAASRLLHRLTALISSSSSVEEAEDSSMFDLDESLFVDPERSVVTPTTMVLATPNGKNALKRKFDSDLLDDIEALRGCWEEYARKTAFASVEGRVKLATAQKRIDQLQLQLELAQAQAQRSSDGEKETLEARVEQLKEQLKESQGKVGKLEVEMERMAAEQELTIAASANKLKARIQALEEEVDDLRSSSSDESVPTPPSSERENAIVAQLEEKLAASTQLNHDLKAQLDAFVEQQAAKTADLHSIVTQLSDKRHKLATIQANTARIDTLESLVEKQERIVSLLDRTHAEREEVHSAWSSLVESPEAAIQTSPQSEQLAEDDVVSTPRSEIVELEARVLRRNEQIGHLQMQLKEAENNLARTRTNQLLAEETVQDLETERDELLEQVAQLEAAASASSPAPAAAAVEEEQLAEARERIVSLETRLAEAKETSAAQIGEIESELAHLRSNLEKAQAKVDILTAELETTTLALAEQRECASSSAETIATLSSQLSSLREELEARVAEISTLSAAADASEAAKSELEAKLTALESALTARDEALKLRNHEFWDLKEELAELQEAAETSRDYASLQTELAAALTAKAELEERVGAQESALLKLKSDLAIARGTEEMLNEQYAAAQRRARELEAQTQGGEGVKEKLEKAEGEVAYLQTRVGELEEELGAKAEEIEEADSKILDALKESKKYMTRYNKLHARYEALQKELQAQQELAKVAKEEVAKLKARREKPDQALVQGSSNVVAGRKRSKEETSHDEPVGVRNSPTASNSGVKAVYLPSPTPTTAALSSSSFTPRRRAGAPSVLGRGTPKAPVPAPTATQADGGMVRSTSNPSELIALRLSASPAKPPGAVVLADRTNLTTTTPAAPSGTSRLSSKTTTSITATSTYSKPLTTLIPNETGENRKRIVSSSSTTPGRKEAAPGVGGGGAADFLAKIKAQRAATASSR